MASFPGSVPVFPTRIDNQPIFASHLNALQEEVTAIATQLVAAPSSSAPRSSPLRVFGTTPTLELDDTVAALVKARLISDVTGNANATTNASEAGLVWSADDVAQQSALLQLQPLTGRLAFWNAPVSANPRALTEKFKVEPTGAIYERGRALALGEWLAYTPVWSGGLGNGTLVGRYTLIGKTVHARVELSCGSTTTYGGGIFSFTLPPGFPAAAPQDQIIGHGRGSQSVHRMFSPVAWTPNPSTLFLCSVDGGGYVAQSVPWTWGAGNGLHFNLTYETP